MKFIQLTSVKDLKPIYFNISNIIMVSSTQYGGAAIHIIGDYVIVKETPEEVYEMLEGKIEE